MSYLVYTVHRARHLLFAIALIGVFAYAFAGLPANAAVCAYEDNSSGSAVPACWTVPSVATDPEADCNSYVAANPNYSSHTFVPTVSDCSQMGIAEADTDGGGDFGSGSSEFAGGLIQKCPDSNKEPGQEGCRDINILLLQLIRIAQFLFSIIGTIAFVFFIYGGFSIILSLGNPEKAKKGHQTLFAAAIGLLIAFSAYILVNFILDALGVDSSFRGL